MTDFAETGIDAGTQHFMWEKYIKAGQTALIHKNTLEATRMFTVAMEKSKKFEKPDWRQLESLRWLALSYMELHQYDKSEEYVCELLDALYSNFGPNSPEVNDGIRILADVYEHQHKYREARQMILHVMQNHPKRDQPNDPDFRATKQRYYELLRKSNRSSSMA